MRMLISMILMTIIVLASGGLVFGASDKLTPEALLEKIHWIEQAAVKIEIGDKVVYIDPYQIKQKDTADVILLTHSHQDHLSPDDIAKVADEDTVFVAPESCMATLRETFAPKVVYQAVPGFNTNMGNFLLEAVPAYNVEKTNFHPKENNWVGYILTIDGVRVYHTGDTERIPEMQDITADIILLPLGQTYTMNSVEEAAEVVRDVQAKIAIPIHFGLYEGTPEDAETFKSLLKDDVQVVIKEKE